MDKICKNCKHYETLVMAKFFNGNFNVDDSGIMSMSSLNELKNNQKHKLHTFDNLEYGYCEMLYNNEDYTKEAYGKIMAGRETMVTEAFGCILFEQKENDNQ